MTANPSPHRTHALADWAGPAFLLLASASILGAFGFELIGGFKPCALCLQQRWPYYAAIPLAALAMAAGFVGRDRLMAGLFALATLVMLAGAALGVYHSGVEWGIFEGPAACAGGGSLDVLTTGDLLTALNAERVVPCTQAQIRFAGLSFANLNVLVSLTLVVLGAIAVRGAWRNHGSSSVSQ